MEQKMQTIHLVIGTKIKTIIHRLFPSYRKQKLYMHIHEKPQLQLATNPGGMDNGSIDNDWILYPDVDNVIQKHDAPQATYANFDRETGFPKVTISSDFALLTEGLSNGNVSTILIHCTSDFYKKYLKD